MEKGNLMKRKACSTETAPKPTHFLMLLTRAGRVISLHRPDGNSIPVGRSSSNTIRVNDPHFPRLAGEVILRPTPLFRTKARGQGKSRLELITPGRPIPLPPYKLFLLEDGEVFRNRKRIFPKNIHALGYLKQAPLLVIVIMLFAVFAVRLHKHAETVGPQRMAVTVPFNIDHRKWFTADKPGNVDKAVAHIDVGKAKRPRSIPVKTEHRLRRTTGHVEETTFSSILKQAAKQLSKYDAAGAGRLITPLLPLLSPGQRDTAIMVLNPYAEEIFKKAYILRPFWREKSDGMMRELAQSGLGILPGVRKAEGINNATGRVDRRTTEKNF